MEREIRTTLPVSRNVVIIKGQIAARAQIRAARLPGRLSVLGLIPFLIGSSFAQAPPQKPDVPRANTVEPEKRVLGSPDQNRNTMDDMLRVMGPYTPREFYPSLMQLPDLSPEKRAEIERQASLRMEDGLQILAESRAALTAATEKTLSVCTAP